MIHILILIALGLATYLFHNYQTFNEASIRPWVLEYVHFNREADPQALCDLLSPDIIFLEGKKRHVRIFQNLQAIFLSRKKKKMGIFLIGYQVLK